MEGHHYKNDDGDDNGLHDDQIHSFIDSLGIIDDKQTKVKLSE